jgi:hypothetical protein
MRSAFVITSHADVDQLERLVRILTSELDVGVYISHDVAGEPGVERLGSERCRVLRERGGRGDFTQIERILSLFEHVEADGGADFVTVLSGQDYPARPIREFLEALDEGGDGFLHHFPALEPTGDWTMHEARQRYLYRWRILWPISSSGRRRWHWLHALNYLQPLLRFNVSYGSFRVGRYRGRLPAGLACYGGSAWFTLSRRAVQHVLATAASRPDIMEWGRTSLAIDEVFFQSILVSAGRFEFVNHNGRFIDFDGDGFGHPRVLGEDDFAPILDSGAYFVRKVDRRASAGLLDLLDRNVEE